MLFIEKRKIEGGVGLGGLFGVSVWNFKFEIFIGRISGDVKG